MDELLRLRLFEAFAAGFYAAGSPLVADDQHGKYLKEKFAEFLEKAGWGK